MRQFLLLFLLFPIVTLWGQKELFVSNKVKQYDCWRQRFFPDQIPKEIYAYTKFAPDGKIIEKYEPYYMPGSGPTTYTYNAHGDLIQIQETKKDGTIRKITSFLNESDSAKRRGYLPSYPRDVEYNMNASLERIITLTVKNETKTIDTFYDKRNNIQKITILRQGVNLRILYSFEFRKNKLKYYRSISEYDSTMSGSYFSQVNKKKQLVEKINASPGQEYFHFKYKYYSTGILKKLTAYSREGIINEVCWYKPKYY